jgi:hypothetical protein
VVTSGPPPGIGRLPAQQLARRELARSIYQPSVWQRLVHAVEHWLNSVLGPLGPAHGGWWTLIVIIVVLVLVIAGVLAWIGPARRSRRQRSAPVLAGGALSAADHRRNAERLLADGDVAGAIVERVRAIAVELESRGVLAARPGRTATELAAEAADALPASAAGLRVAARQFDDVRYGGRRGTLAGYAQVRDLDLSIAATRTATVTAGAAGPGGASAG